MIYPVLIEPGDETHAYGVVVPDLPGCFSAGDTLEEALNNAREAVCLWIETSLDENLPIPKPTDIKAALQDPEYKGWLLAVVDVDLSALSGKAERINITLPARALRRLDRLAEKAGGNRSGFLTSLIYAAS